MASITYEQALARLPKGWSLWGNHGDGKWRAGSTPQENLIVPADTLEEACGTFSRVCGGGGGDDVDCGALDSTGRWRGHYWVEGVTRLGDGFVADITADQFGWPSVVLMPLAAARDRYRRRDDDLVDEVVREELVKIVEGRNG
ncbi:TPA: hypothetical protein ACYLN4_000579 [Burkholderia lata]